MSSSDSQLSIATASGSIPETFLAPCSTYFLLRILGLEIWNFPAIFILLYSVKIIYRKKLKRKFIYLQIQRFLRAFSDLGNDRHRSAPLPTPGAGTSTVTVTGNDRPRPTRVGTKRHRPAQTGYVSARHKF